MRSTRDTTVSVLGLQLTVDQQLRWGRELLMLLKDVIAVSDGVAGPLHGSLRIQRGRLRAVLMYGDALEPGVRRCSAGLVDEEYGVVLNFPGNGEIVLRTEYSCPEWFSWSLQLLALRSRTAFVHAACLERGGKAVLLAARNGFGKTALVGDFMRRGGWRLLGDDLTLLSEDGVCYAYPRALAVQPEHRYFFPELFAQNNGPRAPMSLSSVLERGGRAVKPLLRRVPGLLESARRVNPQAARIVPTDLFPQRVTAAAPLDALIWLERRATLKRPLFQPIEESMAPRILGSTMAEFDPRCVRIANIALSLGLVGLSSINGIWMDVLRAGLARARSYMLAVPASLPFQEMPTLVHQTLLGEGLGPVTLQ